MHFGLDVFCRFEVGVPEFDAVLSVQCILYRSTAVRGRGCMSNSRTLASNRQNTARPKYNDDISLLISQYLISALSVRRAACCKFSSHLVNHHADSEFTLCCNMTQRFTWRQVACLRRYNSACTLSWNLKHESVF